MNGDPVFVIAAAPEDFPSLTDAARVALAHRLTQCIYGRCSRRRLSPEIEVGRGEQRPSWIEAGPQLA
jgi:hypothetical protein